MQDERKEYKCPLCKTRRWLLVKHEFCGCGGKLEPVITMQDVETIFPWMKKGK
jgi:hypothetical protein